MQDMKNVKYTPAKKTKLRHRVGIVLFFAAFAAMLLVGGFGGEWLQHHRAGYVESKY